MVQNVDTAITQDCLLATSDCSWNVNRRCRCTASVGILHIDKICEAPQEIVLEHSCTGNGSMYVIHVNNLS
jgi:hypothetical protein